MLHHDTLLNFYQVMFLMGHKYQWSLSELEEMLPWERSLYIIMLQQSIEEENQRIIQHNNEKASKTR